MPSKAYGRFLWNIETVTRLQDTYKDAKKFRHSKGRGAFDHITRSAIVFLISAFEVYCEEILVEGCKYLIKYSKDAKKLPHDVRNTINNYCRNESNGVPPIELSDEGWRKVYEKIVEEKVDRLNTPNLKNLETLFEVILGVKKSDIARITEIDKLDNIIQFRGEITHRVRATAYVHIETVSEYKDTIFAVVKGIDLLIRNYIKDTYTVKAPWNDTY